MTDRESLTLHQIRQLQHEADIAGDARMVELCDAAAYVLDHDLDRDHESVRAVVAAIRSAEGMAD